MAFDYSNLSDREPGRLLRFAALLLPGVRQVQRQVHPYAHRWEQSNGRAVTESGPLWVAMGDSMTQGIGASAPEQSWPGQLRTMLAHRGLPHRLINLSSTGARVQDILDRQLPAMRSLAEQPALVTVLIGSNDVMSRHHRAGLGDRMAQVLAQLPAGAVVGNLPNPTRSARALSAAVDRAVHDHGIVLADLRDRRTTTWRGKLAADFFHPNDRGYTGMAELFLDAIVGSRPAGKPTRTA